MKPGPDFRDRIHYSEFQVTWCGTVFPALRMFSGSSGRSPADNDINARVILTLASGNWPIVHWVTFVSEA
jgi:hypothetical protein